MPINPLNAELNPICHLLALLGGSTIVVVGRLRVKTIVHSVTPHKSRPVPCTVYRRYILRVSDEQPLKNFDLRNVTSEGRLLPVEVAIYVSLANTL